MKKEVHVGASFVGVVSTIWFKVVPAFEGWNMYFQGIHIISHKLDISFTMKLHGFCTFGLDLPVNKDLRKLHDFAQEIVPFTVAPLLPS